MRKKSNRYCHSEGGATPSILVAKGHPQAAMHGGFSKAKSEQIGRGKPDATIAGNRRAMPSEALSVGKAEARTTGPSSKSIALGRTVAKTAGPALGRELSNGKALGVRTMGNGAKEMAAGKVMGRRFATGGAARNDDMEELKEAKERNKKLAMRKGGSMKHMLKSLHGDFEKEPYMKKLGAKEKDVYEGEPHKGSNIRPKRASGGKMWIQNAISNKGALHKTLGVPKGEKIPEKKLEKAEHSRNPLTRKRAALAETLKGFHH
jgi:hypothetical protein